MKTFEKYAEILVSFKKRYMRASVIVEPELLPYIRELLTK